MPKKLKFQIGDWVLGLQITSFKYIGRERVAVRTPCAFRGVIVGFKTCQIGHYEGGSLGGGGYISDDGPEPPYLSVTGSVGVWLVRRGMMNKAIMAQEQDLLLANSQTYKLPIKWSNSAPWPVEAREEMKKIAREMPRDGRGRFLPDKPRTEDLI